MTLHGRLLRVSAGTVAACAAIALVGCGSGSNDHTGSGFGGLGGSSSTGGSGSGGSGSEIGPFIGQSTFLAGPDNGTTFDMDFYETKSGSTTVGDGQLRIYKGPNGSDIVVVPIAGGFDPMTGGWNLSGIGPDGTDWSVHIGTTNGTPEDANISGSNGDKGAASVSQPQK